MNIDTRPFFLRRPNVNPAVGKVLISDCLMHESGFDRCVILIVEHNNNGTVGFILNKLSDVYLDELISGVSSYKEVVHIGGPVAQNTLHYVHMYGALIPDSVKIAEGLYWSGDFEAVKELINERVIDKSKIRFFIGYSGWDLYQLDKEIKEESWLVTSISSELIFGSEQGLWKKVTASLGAPYDYLSMMPKNPRLN